VRGQQQPPAPPADASRLRIAIIVSRFNAFVTDRLRDGAVAALREAGAAESAIQIFAVPGAFEIPQAARAAAETGRFDAIVCLGCLIRGETPHFEYIASAAAHGITAAAGETGVPMAFGVLTTNTAEQALERAGEGPENKGREAAAAAIEMATLYKTLGASDARPSGFRV
jgi:6,7-dimethyl-8-ribityllumazine synthase